MAIDLYRFRVVLDGWNGGPGINTLHFRKSDVGAIEDLSDIAAMIAQIYANLDLFFVAGVTMRVDSVVDVFDDATGELKEGVSCTPPPAYAFTGGAGTVSRATQMVARLGTNDVKDGRRLQGRIFLGPASGQTLGADGLITPAAQEAVNGSFGGLMDIAGLLRLVVWHRPIPEPVKPGDPEARAGDNGLVTSVQCLSKPGVLRSRRD